MHHQFSSRSFVIVKSQELADLWLQHSKSQAWQTLFMCMGCQNELPATAHETANADAEEYLKNQSEPAHGLKRKATDPLTPQKGQKVPRDDTQISPVKTSICPPKRLQSSRPALFGKAPERSRMLMGAKTDPDEDAKNLGPEDEDKDMLDIQEATEQDNAQRNILSILRLLLKF